MCESAQGGQKRALAPTELELKVTMVCWKPKWGPLQKQFEFLATEPSLQPHVFYLNLMYV